MPAAKRNAFFKASKGTAIPPKEQTSIGVWRPLPDHHLEVDPKITPEQEQQSKQLRAYVDSELALSDSDPYSAMEKKYLDTENCMVRFLKASDWKMEEAKKRVKATLEWRRGYKPDLIPPDEIREETEGGKIIVSGFDNKGRPVMYLRPARENTDPTPTQSMSLYIYKLSDAHADLSPSYDLPACRPGMLFCEN